MADGGSLPVNTAEYEAIEAAVMETARGRWFLAEYARRNRTADTTLLLDAIGRLEQAVAGGRRAEDLDGIRLELSRMAQAIGRAKSEVASLRPTGSASGSSDASSGTLDGIAPAMERATAEILDAAERMQEAAWTLREDGASAELCDTLDRRAAAIYTACSLQDLAARRTAKIVGTLRDFESRITAAVDPRGGSAPAEAEPPILQVVGRSAGADLGRQAGDGAGVEIAPAPITTQREEAAAPANPDAGPAGADEEPSVRQAELVQSPPAAVKADRQSETSAVPRVRTEALAAIDALSTREKLRRFT